MIYEQTKKKQIDAIMWTGENVQEIKAFVPKDVARFETDRVTQLLQLMMLNSLNSYQMLLKIQIKYLMLLLVLMIKITLLSLNQYVKVMIVVVLHSVKITVCLKMMKNVLLLFL